MCIGTLIVDKGGICKTVEFRHVYTHTESDFFSPRRRRRRGEFERMTVGV